MSRPPLPPFDTKDRDRKVRLAEDGWNTRDAAKVSLAYTEDTEWRNRGRLLTGQRVRLSPFSPELTACRFCDERCYFDCR